MFTNLVQGVVALLESAIFVFTQLINIAGKALIVPGIVVIIVAGIIWAVAWKQTRNVVGTIVAIIAFFAVTYALAAYVIFPWVFKGSDAAIISCHESATNEQQKALCNSMLSADYTLITSGNMVAQAPAIIVPNDGANDQQVVRTFKANALEILSQNWSLKPPGESSSMVGPANVPQGLMMFFECDNPIAARKNEVWKVTISGNVPGLGQKTIALETNGHFARDGFDAKPGTSIAGTGSWEQVCPGCYTDVVVTPAPQPTPTPPPAATKVAFPAPICGYWGWIYSAAEWRVVPTTGGQPDYNHSVSKASASVDINKRCPGETLPATP